MLLVGLLAYDPFAINAISSSLSVSFDDDVFNSTFLVSIAKVLAGHFGSVKPLQVTRISAFPNNTYSLNPVH